MAFQGSLRELPLPDIIQLVAVSGKTGVFVLKNGAEQGRIYLDRGQIVHAVVGKYRGEQAVYELARWFSGEFVFEPGTEAPERSIEKSNTNLLMEAARQIDEWKILSKKIGSTRMVPVHAPSSVSTSVSFTPGEWAVLSKVDERRNLEEIAAVLGWSSFEVCKVVYGLLTSGMVQLKEDLRQFPLDRFVREPKERQLQIAEQVHHLALQLLGGHERSRELESVWHMCRLELEGGRGADSLVDLVRSEEKVLSAVSGPAVGRNFVERVSAFLRGAAG
jgi:hypothetical protein